MKSDCVHIYQVDSNDVGVCSKCGKKVDFAAMRTTKQRKKEFGDLELSQDIQHGVTMERY